MSTLIQIDIDQQQLDLKEYLSCMQEACEKIGRNKKQILDCERKIANQLESLASLIVPLQIENHNLQAKVCFFENEIKAMKPAKSPKAKKTIPATKKSNKNK